MTKFAEINAADIYEALNQDAASKRGIGQDR